jgi:hypothetical protein
MAAGIRCRKLCATSSLDTRHSPLAQTFAALARPVASADVADASTRTCAHAHTHTHASAEPSQQ